MRRKSRRIRQNNKKSRKLYKKYRPVVRRKILSRILKFFIKLNIFAIPLYLILITNYQSLQFMEFTASASFGIMKAIGIPATIDGTMMTIPLTEGSFAAYVSWDSTGWKALLAFFALVFATDFSWRKKFYGLFLLPIIYFINVLRIVFMFYAVHNFGAGSFDFFHATLWSWGLIFTILFLWVIWLRYVNP